MGFDAKLKKNVNQIATLEFSSERKMMSTLVTNYRNEKDLLIKGAPDRVIANCTKFMSLGNQVHSMTSQARAQILQHVEDLSLQSLRVIAIAEVPNGGKLALLTNENKYKVLEDPKKYADFETEAVFIGLVGIKDPVRPEVKPAIADCKTAGIRVIMITGDSKETATAIAQELEILEPGQSLTDSVFTGT